MAIDFNKPFEIRDIRNGEWYWVQKEILSSKNINSSDKLVYSALAYYANNKNQQCYPSYIQLGKLIDLSERTVYKSIKALIKYKFISVKKKQGKVNFYELLRLTHANFAPDQTDTPMQNNTTTHANKQVVPMQNNTTNNTYTNKNYITREREEKKPASLDHSIQYLQNIPDSDLQEFADKFNVSYADIFKQAKQLINYCEMHGKQYKNYKAFLRNSLLKDFGERKSAQSNPIFD